MVSRGSFPFTDRHERFVQIVSNRHTENEAAGLGSADYITVYFFYKMLHLIYGKLQSVCVLQDTRYISENNTRFREIRNTSYVILYFFIKYSSVSSRFDNSPYSIASIFFCVNFVSDRKQGRKIRYLRLFCIFKNNSGY